MARPLESLEVVCPGCQARHRVLGKLSGPGAELGLVCRRCKRIFNLEGQAATACRDTSSGLVGAIERLSRLREAGDLTDEEFETLKAKLLG